MTEPMHQRHAEIIQILSYPGDTLPEKALRDAIRELTEHTQAQDVMRVTNLPIRSSKVGRNEHCPCGSGKKFKKCCGAPGRSLQ